MAIRSWGVEAVTTFCATLTLPRRLVAPANGRIAIVDALDIDVPRPLQKRAVYISHTVAPSLSNNTKIAYARDLLDFYRNEVSLVITGRLHCALPCAAMGIPVVFFGAPSETRIHVLNAVGIPIHDSKKHRRTFGSRVIRSLQSSPVDWSPKAADTSELAEKYGAFVRQRL